MSEALMRSPDECDRLLVTTILDFAIPEVIMQLHENELVF